jgi:hypothetical protein
LTFSSTKQNLKTQRAQRKAAKVAEKGKPLNLKLAAKIHSDEQAKQFPSLTIFVHRLFLYGATESKQN